MSRYWIVISLRTKWELQVRDIKVGKHGISWNNRQGQWITEENKATVFLKNNINNLQNNICFVFPWELPVTNVLSVYQSLAKWIIYILTLVACQSTTFLDYDHSLIAVK
jgi:hypothetical protein